jgi:hypothetical protein
MGFLTIIQHMTLVQLQPRTQQLYIYLTILPLNLKQHKHEQAFIIEREREREIMGGEEEWRKNAETHQMSPEEVKATGVEGSKRPPGNHPGGILHRPEAHFSLQLYHHGHWGPPYRWRHRILHLIRQEKT